MSPFVEGVRDLLPAEIKERKWLYQQLREVFYQSGYQEVATPTLESLELYTGAEALLKERMFKVVDEKGQILVLKPDVTMPIARMAVTQYQGIPKPWKFSYITTAYLTNGGQWERMKEKTQAGIELMGCRGLFADVEVIGLLVEALQKLGIEKPLIDIGQANLIGEIFQNLNLEADAKEELRILLEEKNVQEIRAKLTTWKVSAEEQEILVTLPVLFGAPEEVLAGLKSLKMSPKAEQVVRDLEEIYFCLQKMGLGEYIAFDPGMVTNLGYYTGIIFKAYVPGYGEVVASGGRYDDLTQRFGQNVPAIGFAIEIEGLLDCLKGFNQSRREIDEGILFRVKRQKDYVTAYKISGLLRAQGIRVEIYNAYQYKDHDYRMVVQKDCLKDNSFHNYKEQKGVQAGDSSTDAVYQEIIYQKRVYDDANQREYAKYNHLTYIGEWQDEDLILINIIDQEEICFSGQLSQITLKIVEWIKGGLTHESTKNRPR